MSKFRKKPVVIEAITFEELVAHGKANGANIVEGMPWSWKYNGHPITHENATTYLIPTLTGTAKFFLGDMLITGVNGEIYPCPGDVFSKTYEPVNEAVAAPHPAMLAVLQFFAFSHLPPALQSISKPFHDLAWTIAEGPSNAEATVALRKLLEAKDAAVRAVLFKA